MEHLGTQHVTKIRDRLHGVNSTMQPHPLQRETRQQQHIMMEHQQTSARVCKESQNAHAADTPHPRPNMITDHFWPQHSMFKTPERTRGERGEGGSCTPKRSTSHIVSEGSSCWDIEYLNAQSLNHTHTRHLATVRFCGLHAKPRHALNNYIIDVTPMMQVATRKHQPPATIVDCNHCNGQTTTHNTTHKHFGFVLIIPQNTTLSARLQISITPTLAIRERTKVTADKTRNLQMQ